MRFRHDEGMEAGLSTDTARRRPATRRLTTEDLPEGLSSTALDGHVTARLSLGAAAFLG